jgi:hypothetical protein
MNRSHDRCFAGVTGQTVWRYQKLRREDFLCELQLDFR